MAARGLAIVLLVLASVISQATAEPAAPSELAKTKFELGTRAYNSRRFGDAILLLEESLRLFDSPNGRLVLGHCYRETGRLAAALQTYKDVAKIAAERIRAGQRQAEGARQNALEFLADLEPRVPQLTLAVPSNIPVDFSLRLDGIIIPREQWGAMQPVNPGAHEIAASGTRMQPFAKTVQIAEGERQRIEVTPNRDSSSVVRVNFPPPRRPPGTELFFDDQPVPLSLLDGPMEVEPGIHRLVLHAPGHRLFNWQRTLNNGDRVDLSPNLRLATPRLAVYIVGAIAVGALLATVGVGSSAQFQSDEQERKWQSGSPINDPHGDPKAYNEYTEKKATIGQLATSANVLGGIGAVMAVSTMALALTTEWRRGPAPASKRAVGNTSALAHHLQVLPGLTSIFIKGLF